MQATVHLVRHGEVANPQGVIYGRLPGYSLSERGIRQAHAVADRLRERDVGGVWASPLERAQETAEIIAQAFGFGIVTDDRLIESATTLEGAGRNLRTFLMSPKLWWQIRDPFSPSWGESFRDIRTRMVEVVWEALEKAEGKEVVLVSHQTPVQAARLALARRRRPPWMGDPCATGSLTTLTLETDRVVSASYYAPPP
jgi:broad specificity phosphatase PhoE